MIQPSDTAPLGSVTHHDTFGIQSLPPTSVVLCRNKAPLITLAFRCLRAAIPVTILGRDIGDELRGMITKSKATSLPELTTFLHLQRDKELNYAKSETASDNINDKYACLLELIPQVTSVSELNSALDELFRERTNVLTFATIHKAKGLEWPDVFILDWHLLPSKYARAPWQKAQERNLQYVAATRAQLNLHFITTTNTK